MLLKISIPLLEYLTYLALTLFYTINNKNARFEDRAYYISLIKVYTSKLETLKALSSMNFLRGST